MNEKARKPVPSPDPPLASTIGRVGKLPSLDDQSIPVLTERLTLPPLDLDLEFRLPPASSVAPAVDSPPSAPIDEFELPPEEPESSPDDDRLARITDMPLVLDTSLPEFDVPSDFMRDPLTSAPTVPVSRLDQAEEFRLPKLPPQPMMEASASAELAPSANLVDEIELREAVLREIARNLPYDVEAIVNQHLEAAVRSASERLAAEVRFAVAASLREVVERAVNVELARRKRK